jgi:hypothetical protein
LNSLFKKFEKIKRIKMKKMKLEQPGSGLDLDQAAVADLRHQSFLHM